MADEKPIIRYKFLTSDMKSKYGDDTWTKDVWRKYDGELAIGTAGFHCSKTIHEARAYVDAIILAKVEVRGESFSKIDKEVWSEMKIIQTWKWRKIDNVELMVYLAGLLIDDYEAVYPNDDNPRQAIKSAKDVIANDSEENRSKAINDARLARQSEANAIKDKRPKEAEMAAWAVAAAEYATSSEDNMLGSESGDEIKSSFDTKSVQGSFLVDSMNNWIDNRVDKLEEII